MNTASVMKAAASAPNSGRRTLFCMSAAATHAASAAAVLLSVRSVPNGQPVQYAPKAYFCTRGPRTSPPAARSPIVRVVSLLADSRPPKTHSPVRVERSNPENIRTMWTTSMPAGTSPLKRMTADPPAGTVIVSFPRYRAMRYLSFPAGG